MTHGVALAAHLDAEGRHDDAIDELAHATQAGDLEAMTALGKRLVTGDRAPHLPDEGVRMLLDAAAAGSAEAALRMATLAALGAYTKQDWGQALGFLVFAAERGAQAAAGALATLARLPAGAAPPAGGWAQLARGIELRFWLEPPPGTTLHERPAIRAYPEFVTDAVCAWLIERARGRLRRALIYDPAYGGDVADSMRTNSAAGFDLMDADLVQIAVQQRMAAAVGLPVRNMEGPTILHYAVGQEITNHFDFLNPNNPSYEEEVRRRGERIVTFLVYLNDDYGGGETEFPELRVRHKGRRREGLFFVNALPNGQPDTRMVHAGRPPTSGEKWIVSQFIRNRPALNARAEHIG
jgi:hypothetical protein